MSSVSVFDRDTGDTVWSGNLANTSLSGIAAFGLNLYATDAASGSVYAVFHDPGATVLRWNVEQLVFGDFDNPSGIDVAPDGTAYVIQADGSVFSFPAVGFGPPGSLPDVTQVLDDTAAGDLIEEATDLAWTPAGIYITDSIGNRLFLLDTDSGDVAAVAGNGSGGNPAGGGEALQIPLDSPFSVAATDHGTIIVGHLPGFLTRIDRVR